MESRKAFSSDLQSQCADLAVNRLGGFKELLGYTCSEINALTGSKPFDNLRKSAEAETKIKSALFDKLDNIMKILINRR